MGKTIYMVGKPFSETAIARQLRELGYTVGIFLDNHVTLKHPELFDAIVPLDFSAPETFKAQLASTGDLTVDGLICVYENYLVAKAMLGEALGIPTISVDSARCCTDKLLMRQAFADADPAITPEFTLVSSQEDLLRFADTHTYPLMLKPTNLVKSLLIMRCNDRKELLHNYQLAQQSIEALYERYHIYEGSPRLIIEEYIEGSQCSVAAYVDAAGVPHFCGGVTTLVTAAEIGISDSYLFGRQLPGTVPAKVEEKIFATASKAIQALGMRSSPAHVELIWNQDTVKVVEIGARTGGYRYKMYRLAYGTDLLAAEVTTALGDTPVVPETAIGICGVYELFPPSVGQFQTITGGDVPGLTLTIRAKADQEIGPAKLGYKAAAVVTVFDTDEQQFKQRAEQVQQMQVVTS